MEDEGRGSTRDQDKTEYWRSVLNGDDKGLRIAQQRFGKMQAPPRCKLCRAPFAGPYVPILRLAGFKRWDLNQQLCRRCFGRVEDHQGGAEIPVSVLYADIRGSTTIAETTSSVDFTRMLNQFYKVVTEAVDAEMGAIDHMAGDGIMVMWVPAFVDEHHAKHAIAAGRRILQGFPDMATLPVGVGVHTGEAYVGVVGEAGARNFTVLGDTPNTVARLSSAAGAGELVMSEAAATAAGVETANLQHLMLDLKGKSDPFPAWIERAVDVEESE